MEAILYYVSKNYSVLILFLTLVFSVGIYIYTVTQKFNIHKKSTRYCGLLTGLSNREIIILSSLIIRTYMIIYTSLIYRNDITEFLILIFFADIVYMILKPKKIIFELINITTQTILIYFTNVLKTYRIEVSNEMFVEQIIIILIGISVMYSIYFFLRNFEELIDKEAKRYEKE